MGHEPLLEQGWPIGLLRVFKRNFIRVHLQPPLLHPLRMLQPCPYLLYIKPHKPHNPPTQPPRYLVDCVYAPLFYYAQMLKGNNTHERCQKQLLKNHITHSLDFSHSFTSLTTVPQPASGVYRRVILPFTVLSFQFKHLAVSAALNTL